MQIHSYIKNSFIDFPGKIACVVFTKGCNWNCWYCLNKDITSDQSLVEEEHFFTFLKERKNFLDGVVICGGEPTLQPDLERFARRIKELGLTVKLDTNGTNPEILKQLLSQKLLDYVAMDIKAPFERYEQVAGTKVRLEDVRKSMQLLLNSGLPFEFRTTCCPELSEDDLIGMARQLSGTPLWVLQRFIVPEEYKDKNLKFFSQHQLEEIAERCCEFVKTTVR